MADIPRSASAASTETADSGRMHSAPPRKSRRRWNGPLVVGLAIVLITAVSALAAPWLSPYEPDAMDIPNRLSGPTADHWFGSDEFGRDWLTRLLWGGRVSLSIGFLASLVAMVLGTLVGSVAGYFGGWWDAVLSRLIELKLVIPSFFLAILVIAFFGSSVTLLIILLGILVWPVPARLVRGEVLKIKAREFVMAAEAIGATNARIIFFDILPNIASIVIFSTTVRVGIIIIIEASLSFVGLGVQEPQSSWGTMIAKATPFVRQAWWLVAIPGAAMFVTVFGFNMLGEGVRDLLDPRGGKARAV